MEAGTMATEKEITDLRDSGVELLDEKIGKAIAMKNTLGIRNPRRLKLSTTINQLMDSRTDLHIQELRASLDSAQLAAALERITAASRDLRTEAAKMKTVTSYLKNANAVIGVATKVTNIVKNGR